MKAKPFNGRRQRNLPNVLLRYFAAMHTRFADQHWWPADSPLEVMVGAVLTQSTSWHGVEKAIVQLKAAGVLNARSLFELGPAGIAPLITAAGDFNLKSRRLWNLMAWLVQNHHGDMAALSRVSTAQLRGQLLAVSGVGPETADSILLYALGRPVFVIDAYTRRILERHQLAPAKATYHELQQIMTRNLPENVELFNEFHAQIVQIGKHFCKPTPACKDCPLRKYLPAGVYAAKKSFTLLCGGPVTDK